MTDNPVRPARVVQLPVRLRGSPDIAQTGGVVAGKAGGFPGARKRPAEDSATAGGSNGAGAAAERATGGLTQPVPSDAELRHCLEILDKSFLGCPATTAELERVFSKAGKPHDDQRKRTLDVTLEQQLFAAFNWKC